MRRLATLLVALLVASACGGGSDSAELEALREEVASLKATTTVAPTTTRAPTTTVVRGSWEREITQSQMDDSVTTRLSLASSREELGFLSQEPNLIIICKKGYIPLLFFQGSDGFGGHTYNGDNEFFFDLDFRVRFGDDDPYTMVAAQADMYGKLASFPNPVATIRKMTRYDTLLIENDYPFIGRTVDSFDLRGLSYQLSEYGRDCGV